jgi:hypothetical protein
MTLRKFLTYLNYTGSLLFILYLIGSIAWHHTMNGFKESDTLLYLMHVGVFMMFPLWIYKLCHFKEFKSENVNHLVTLGILFVLAILFIIFKG